MELCATLCSAVSCRTACQIVLVTYNNMVIGKPTLLQFSGPEQVTVGGLATNLIVKVEVKMGLEGICFKAISIYDSP